MEEALEPSAFDRCGAAFDEVVAPLARGEASAAAAAAAEDAILPHRLKCSTGGKAGQTAAQLAERIGGCLSIRSGTFLYAPVEKRVQSQTLTSTSVSPGLPLPLLLLLLLLLLTCPLPRPRHS